jgi:hypothetical protein
VTEQYGQPNINNPRLARSFAAVAAPTLVQLNFDDQFVVADSTLGLIGFTLPLASQFPVWEIIIKATNAGTTGNSVYVESLPGETIDGAPFVLLTTDEEALFLKSDGTNWRVVNGGSGAAPSSSVSLDIMFDSTAAASVAPILFVTWPEVMAAVAAIPGNFAAPYQKTKYRLNVQTLGSIDPGLYDLSNAEFRSAIKSSPFGSGAFLGGGGAFTLDNLAQINGISIFGAAFAPTFTWSTFNFVEMIDSAFAQPVNGPPGPPFVAFEGAFSVMRCYGNCSFGVGTIGVGLGPPATLVIDAYDRILMTSGAAVGSGDLDINIFSGACDISLAQTSIAGTFNINIGGGQTSNGELYSLGETIFFSSGPILFNTTAEQEIYAGGTNPPGAAPQSPPFTTPSRGYTAPKNGYLRGIGVTLPTRFLVPPNTFTVRVYVAGALVLTETFTTTATRQFSADTFGEYNEGDSIQVTIASDVVTDPSALLADGIVVSLRSA